MSQLNSAITALGYLGIQANSLDAWTDYATQFVGLQAGERAGGQAQFRLDSRRHRLTVHETNDATGIAYFGWELANASSMQQLAARLEGAGVKVTSGSASLCAQRGVQDLICFADPQGNALEAFYGAAQAANAFVSGRNVSGFRAGTLGLGHAVLTVTHAAPMLKFYTEVLGFGLSDYVTQPFNAYFLHVNGRHHSLALIEAGKPSVHHIMFEMMALDDVGQAYDLALGIPERIGTTLGRHTNDFVTSFYARSPSQFMVEIGWGGRMIDPANWQAFEVTEGPSLWGHDRHWLPPDAQAQARRMRLQAAEQGLRHPLQVVPGQYQEVPLG